MTNLTLSINVGSLRSMTHTCVTVTGHARAFSARLDSQCRPCFQNAGAPFGNVDVPQTRASVHATEFASLSSYTYEGK